MFDYETMAHIYYNQGYRSGDYEHLAAIHGLNEHQADEICECLKVIEEYCQSHQGG